MQRGSPEKKIPAQAVSEKKKFVQAENSLPPPPHHFSNGPSLMNLDYPVSIDPTFLVINSSAAIIEDNEVGQ